MAGFSNHLAQAAINHFFRNQSVSAPSAHYLALAVQDPTDVTSAALSAEISASWYSRKAISFESPSGATDVTTTNTAQVVFDATEDNAVTVTHWMVFDAATSGNLLGSDALPTPKVLNVDDVMVLNGGELVLTFE